MLNLEKVGIEVDRNYLMLKGICGQFVVWSHGGTTRINSSRNAVTNCKLAMGDANYPECIECMTRACEDMWGLTQ